jgi:hypothetical protein
MFEVICMWTVRLGRLRFWGVLAKFSTTTSIRIPQVSVSPSSYKATLTSIDIVTWETQADEDKLQILHRGSPVFTSFHTPGISATGNDASTGPHTHKVHITDFIQALESCLRPEVINISTDEEDAATRAASQKRKRRYTALRR